MIHRRGRFHVRAIRCVAVGGVAWLIVAVCGCNILPREDLRALAQDLRPPAEVEIDEAAAASRIRAASGVEQFEPADDFLTDNPPVPSWAMGFMKILVDDD